VGSNPTSTATAGAGHPARPADGRARSSGEFSDIGREGPGVLEPQSTALFLLLMVIFVLLIWWTVKVKQVALRVFATCLAFVPAMLFGVAAVNKYYDYYETWGAVVDDFTNQGTNQTPVLNDLTSQKFGKILGSDVNETAAKQQGYTVRLLLTGKTTHIKRSVYVFLPPQYFQSAYANYKFPVLELFNGFPGEPSDWINVLGIPGTLNALTADGLAKPVVLVMPDSNGSRDLMLQCQNIPHVSQDANYLAQDVPNYISHVFRVRPPGVGWGAMGYSEGGYCAANLALEFPKAWGYAGVMSGYFTPLPDLYGHPDRYRNPFAKDRALYNYNSPLYELPLLEHSIPIPQFWVGAGSDNAEDVQAADQFHQILLAAQPKAPLVFAPGGGHNGFTWRYLIEPLLEWITPRVTSAVPPHASVHHGRSAGASTCPNCLDEHGAASKKSTTPHP
jgi:enterochelin esterase-like enzyme